MIRIIFWVVVHRYYKVMRSWGNNYSMRYRVKSMVAKISELKG